MTVMTTPQQASPPITETFHLQVPEGTLRVRGKLLGSATSQRREHNHPGVDFREPGEGHCSACRWFEVKIILVSSELGDDHHDGRYLVHTMGPSIVPGEITKCNAFFTNSPHEILEFLTVSRRQDGATFVPRPALRAMAQAAVYDEDIEYAYVNRPTI